MIQRILKASTFLCAALILSACQALFSFSPDRAAVQEIVLNSPSMNEIHRDTIRVLQMQEFDPGIMVLATYLATAEEDQMSECLALFQTEKTTEGWDAHSQGAACWPAALVDTDPIQVIYGQTNIDGQSSSNISGLVYKPEINTIEIVWEDGENQKVEVIKGSYLALRLGQQEFQVINALNESGELVYSYEKPTPAPGKETP